MVNCMVGLFLSLSAKTSPPDLVLSEIKMLGRDGFELLRKIRALGMSAGGSVPIIAMSALVTHLSARTLEAGFQACLPKPFNPDKLVATILTVLKNQAVVSRLGEASTTHRSGLRIYSAFRSACLRNCL
jgi:DNA-binding response OmpR family regulator